MAEESLVLNLDERFIEEICFQDRDGNIYTNLVNPIYQVLKYDFTRVCRPVKNPNNPCKLTRQYEILCCKKILFEKALTTAGSYFSANFTVTERFCSRDTYFIHYYAETQNGDRLFKSRKFRIKKEKIEESS